MPKGPRDWSPAMKDVKLVGVQGCMVIVAPDWFARKDFQEWRQKSDVASWHEEEPQGQDVFIVYADDEPDWHTESMPVDISRKLLRIVEDKQFQYGVIWIRAV